MFKLYKYTKCILWYTKQATNIQIGIIVRLSGLVENSVNYA